MQQHHTARQAHMRLPPHTNNIQIHPTPAIMTGQTPTQPQQQQHMKMLQPSQQQHSMPTQPPAAMSNAPPHMRDQAQNRANNHKHQPAAAAAMQHNQTAQMQKIRQQHQHLNHTTNANINSSSCGSGNNSNNNNNANQKPQYGNQINMQPQQPHSTANTQQQPHNHQPHHHQQQQTRQQPVTTMHGQQQQHQYNMPPMKNAPPPHGALKQILPNNAIRPPSQEYHHQMQHQQHFSYNYTAGNRPKSNSNYYSNNMSSSSNTTTKPNAAATFSTPKAILQNPNRLKKLTTTSQNAAALPTKQANDNDEQTTVECAKENVEANESAKAISNVETEVSLQKSASSVEANKENLSNDSSECGGNDTSNNNILCNDDSLAKNSKEKTPMCLVNELARYNKITHQYRLTSEKGPAHSKRFTVTLKLGDEEYTAEGFKIKKAQHAAAAQALEKTAYKHPIPKAIRNHDDNKPRPYIMPTVELNALAMKLGQQTYYLYDPRQMPPPVSPAEMHEHAMHDASMPPQHFGGGTRGIPLASNSGSNLMPLPPQQRLLNETASYGPRRHFDAGFCGATVAPPPLPPHMPNCPPQRPFGPTHRGGFNMMNRYRYPMMAPTMPVPPHMHPPHYGMIHATPYKITLIVGNQKFVGSGRTLQHAKHDAAAKALQVLKSQKQEEQKDELDDSMDENDVKSPISQVHEAGIKRNLTVHFKIIREDGPAHMRNFITACIMGTLVTEGEGHGKKISKKRAAEKMLLEIKKLPPVSTPQKTPAKRTKTKTPSKLIEGKEGNETAEREVRGKREKFVGKERPKKTYEPKAKDKEKEKIDNEEECPITKLLQLMQRRKQKEPAFELIAKSGSSEKSKKREFIVEVTAQGHAARGTGVNKKIAKRNAAENLLHTLLEEDNSSSDNDVTEEKINLDDEDDDDDDDEDATFELTNKQTSPPLVRKNVKKEDAKNLDLPTRQVPGILILRQSKKPTIAKKKETSATSSTPARSVKASAKRIDVNTSESAAENNVDGTVSKKDNPKSDAKIAAAKPAVDEHVESLTEEEEEEVEAEKPEPAETAAKTTTNNASQKSTADSTSAVNEKQTTSNSNNNTSSTSVGSSGAASSMMKQQLLYLANLLGFEVNFSDFPKGNHNEFLTIVALSTDPPQMCHGFGQNTNESQNDAARNALKILSDLGLNNAKSN